MTRQADPSENINDNPGATFSANPSTKPKWIKILLIVVFLVVLVGVIRVVRYTKHNLPPSTALLPVPTETLERQKGE